MFDNLKARMTRDHGNFKAGEVVEVLVADTDNDVKVKVGSDWEYVAASAMEPIEEEKKPAAGTISIDVVPDLTKFNAALAGYFRSLADELDGGEE